MSKPKSGEKVKAKAATTTKPKASGKPAVKAQKPKLTTDVLETFALGEEGILCLTVSSNEDRDLHRSSLLLSENFGGESAREVFSKPTWIYSLVKVSDNDVYIAYSGGTLGRGDPRAGTVVAVFDTGKQITKLCSSSKGVFVIGLDGYVGHFDGVALTDMPLPGVTTAYCVSEAPDGTVYAAAERGGLFRRESEAWKAIQLGVTDDVHRVVGLDATSVLLCGANGLCGRLDGTTFVRYQAPSSRHYSAMVSFKGRLYVGAGFHGLDVLEGDALIPFKENVFSYHLATSGKYLFASGRHLAARFDGNAWVANAFTNG